MSNELNAVLEDFKKNLNKKVIKYGISKDNEGLYKDYIKYNIGLYDQCVKFLEGINKEVIPKEIREVVEKELTRFLDIANRALVEHIKVTVYKEAHQHEEDIIELLKDRLNNLFRSSMFSYLTENIKDLGIVSYKLTDINNLKLEEVGEKIIYNWIDNNKEHYTKLVGEFWSDSRNLVGGENYRADNIYDVLFNYNTSKNQVDELVGLLLEYLARCRKITDDSESEKIEEVNWKKTIYDLLDSPIDPVAVDRMNRIDYIIKESGYQLLGKGNKVGLITIGDKKGIQLLMKGNGYYISTKGIYMYNKAQKRIDILDRYTSTDEGGLLDWWFSNSKEGTYNKFAYFIHRCSSEKLTKEDEQDIKSIYILLTLGYNRRKKITKELIEKNFILNNKG